MNIIILDENYQFLTQLKPSQVKATIIKEEDKFNQLELVYSPIDEDDYIDSLDYFKLGNKIFVYEHLNMNTTVFNYPLNNNGLYVMNTNVKREYYEKNKITVTCEDVITELNNNGVILQWNESGIYQITDENINRWFKPYNCIIFKNLEEETSKNRVKIVGSINRINLLRKIEEITGLKAITNYEYSDRITKNLYFLDKSEIGSKKEEIIEVGYNSESLSYEIDESDSYNSINPIFSVGDDSDKVRKFKQIAQGWLDLQVRKGDRIAYELDRSGDKTVPIYATSFFNKDKGSTCIYTSEELLEAPKLHEATGETFNKSGTVDISLEMDKKDTLTDYLQMVFSKCAKELEKHLSPKITLDLDVNNKINKYYHLYDKLIVKVPFHKKYLKAYVSKICYDPLNPVEAQIEVKTDDSNLNKFRKDTKIKLEAKTTKDKKGNIKKANLIVSLTDKDGINRLKKILHLVVIKSSENYSIKKKVKNKNYKANNTGGTITITCKPSCSYKCGSYKWRTRTWVNRCPFCGGKLKINPKHTAERELTCVHCDADFCGNCGRDKAGGGSRRRLTKATKKKKGSNRKYTTHTIKKVRKGYIKDKKFISNADKDIIIPFTQKKGKYKVIIYFEGDEEYCNSKAELKLTIK